MVREPHRFFIDESRFVLPMRAGSIACRESQSGKVALVIHAVLTPEPTCRDANGLDSVYAIDEDTSTLGRSRENTVVLNVSSVSRRHATLRRSEDGGWTLENHSAPNPVRVNGIRGEKHDLHSGDRIQIGQLDFAFEAYRSVGDTSLLERAMTSPFSIDSNDPSLRSDRDRRLLDLLVDVIERSEHWKDPQGVLEHIQASVRELIECDVILVARVEGGKLLLEREQRYCSTVMLHTLKQETCVLWHGSEELAPSRSAGGFGIHSVVCAPVGVPGKEIRALVYAHRTAPEPFEESDLEILRAAARVAGTVLDNLEMRNQLAAQVEKLEVRVRSGAELHVAGTAMKKLVEDARRIAPSALRILLRGETGTGKDVIARWIHAQSERSDGPFVPINCAAIPENLLESELFGYAKSSGIANANPAGRIGKIAKADGGTLFLDEIGDLPAALQAKLLRVLETGEVEPIGSNEPTPVDFRLLCATHQPLETMMEEGRFRRDLYHRVRGHELLLPALRDRAEEIPEFAVHFATSFLAERGVEPVPDPLFAPDALVALSHYLWPGNVRELRNVIEAAVIQSRGGTIAARHLNLADVARADDSSVRAPIRTLEEVKRAHAREVLEVAGGNKKLAAELLGIHRNTLAQLVRKGPDPESPTETVRER